MKTAGIIGGLGPESTIEYYRSIIAEYRERSADGSSPSLLIDSLDVRRLLGMSETGKLDEMKDYLLESLRRLARAGADFGAIAANTPHIVFDDLQRESPLRLVSIVEAACDEVLSNGLRRVALFGTKFMMKGTFFSGVFSRRGVDLVVPNRDEQEYLHNIYVSELLNNVFSPASREGILALADEMCGRDQIEAVVLGGTELPLLLKRDRHGTMRFFDTTRIHCSRIVAELLA